MNRSEIEHAIRAVCALVDETELIVIGSQSVLAQFPYPPPEVTYSAEVDVYVRDHPEKSDLITGARGEGSHFEITFGFYVDGVEPETATLPEGWDARLIPIRNENTRFCTGWCLEVHDLAASKLVAGREKDLAFVGALLRYRMLAPAELRRRIAGLPVSAELRRSWDSASNVCRAPRAGRSRRERGSRRVLPAPAAVASRERRSILHRTDLHPQT